MDVLFFDQSRYELMYNCTRYPIDMVPIEVRRKVAYGIAVLVMALMFTVNFDAEADYDVYLQEFMKMDVRFGLLVIENRKIFSNLLCLRAIYKFLHLLAYKILFIIGLNDTISLIISAIYGIFLIQGAEFCSAPLLQYSLGMISLFCWAQSTTLQLLLAIERCLAQIWPKFAIFLFDGLRIFPWLLFILIYSVYYGFFTTPLLFSSTIGTIIPDPFLVYRDANEPLELHEMFKNDFDRLHAHVIAIALPSVYAIFGILFSNKWGQIQSQPNEQQIEMRRSIFIQIFTVSILDFLGCVLISAAYLIQLPYIISSLIILFVILICGLPSVIYLFFNKTLRFECLRQLGWNKVQPVISGTIKNAWA